MVTELSVGSPLEVLTFVAEADKAVLVGLKNGESLQVRYGGLEPGPHGQVARPIWEVYFKVAKGWFWVAESTLLRTLEGEGPYWLEVIHE